MPYRFTFGIYYLPSWKKCSANFRQGQMCDSIWNLQNIPFKPYHWVLLFISLLARIPSSRHGENNTGSCIHLAELHFNDMLSVNHCLETTPNWTLCSFSLLSHFFRFNFLHILNYISIFLLLLIHFLFFFINCTLTLNFHWSLHFLLEVCVNFTT